MTNLLNMGYMLKIMGGGQDAPDDDPRKDCSYHADVKRVDRIRNDEGGLPVLRVTYVDGNVVDVPMDGNAYLVNPMTGDTVAGIGSARLPEKAECKPEYNFDYKRDMACFRYREETEFVSHPSRGPVEELTPKPYRDELPSGTAFYVFSDKGEGSIRMLLTPEKDALVLQAVGDEGGLVIKDGKNVCDCLISANSPEGLFEVLTDKPAFARSLYRFARAGGYLTSQTEIEALFESCCTAFDRLASGERVPLHEVIPDVVNIRSGAFHRGHPKCAPDHNRVCYVYGDNYRNPEDFARFAQAWAEGYVYTSKQDCTVWLGHPFLSITYSLGYDIMNFQRRLHEVYGLPWEGSVESDGC